jgi:hypothetical protein
MARAPIPSRRPPRKTKPKAEPAQAATIAARAKLSVPASQAAAGTKPKQGSTSRRDSSTALPQPRLAEPTARPSAEPTARPPAPPRGALSASSLPPLGGPRVRLLRLPEAWHALGQITARCEIVRSVLLDLVEGLEASGLGAEAKDALDDMQVAGQRVSTVLERILLEALASSPPDRYPAETPEPAYLAEGRAKTLSAAAPQAPMTMTAAREALDRRLIRDALAAERSNRSRASRRLGITRQGLLAMMRRYGIEG